MKKLVRRFYLLRLLAVGFFLASPQAQAQKAVGDVIKAGQADANKLIRAYVEPGGKAVGHGLNSGWFNSGKPMGLGRFDVRVFGTAVFAPESETSFDISSLNLTNIRLANGQSPVAPTVLGAESQGPQMVVYGRNAITNEEEELTRFNTPAGLGYEVLPVPMAQLSLGLVKDTEVAVRFVPTTTVDEYTGRLWGVGVKHGLKQWLPFVSGVPFFDLTVFGGYTFAEAAADIVVTPDPAASRTSAQQQAGYYDNQQVVYTTKAWTTSLVAAKTVGIMNIYGGVKYSQVTTDVNVNGRYPVTTFRVTPPTRYIEDVENPVAVNLHDSQLGLTGGVRLQLKFFSIYGEGTLAKYPSATAGIGFGFY